MKRAIDGAGSGSEAMDEGEEEVPLEDYFEGYMKPSVHQVMLADAPRNAAYRRAVESLRGQMEGRTVLDVGCGTGLLAMMAARHGGAARVYAVEASPLAAIAREIVAANNLDHIITVIHGRIEDIELPEQVDFIISEWMGFYLLNESMLSSVLLARDRFLKADGQLIPSSARLMCAPVSSGAPVEFWSQMQSQGEFDMSPMIRVALAEQSGSPVVTVLRPDQLLATPQVLVSLELRTMAGSQVAEVGGTLSWDVQRAGLLTGVALWFECPDMGFDTGPMAPPTHWKQVLLQLPTYAQVDLRQPLLFQIRLQQSLSDPRSYGAAIAVSGFMDHDVDCLCLKCQLVRGE